LTISEILFRQKQQFFSIHRHERAYFWHLEDIWDFFPIVAPQPPAVSQNGTMAAAKM